MAYCQIYENPDATHAYFQGKDNIPSGPAHLPNFAVHGCGKHGIEKGAGVAEEQQGRRATRGTPAKLRDAIARLFSPYL